VKRASSDIRLVVWDEWRDLKWEFLTGVSAVWRWPFNMLFGGCRLTETLLDDKLTAIKESNIGLDGEKIIRFVSLCGYTLF
jgi:hypothetical protein